LDEIHRIEALLADRFNGDLRLAESQILNGNWTTITKDQLAQIHKKEILQQSLDEHQTIFNIYKGFHKKSEPKVEKSEFSDQ
jgi:hypothetical protein